MSPTTPFEEPDSRLPTTVPIYTLTEAEQVEGYGIRYKRLPPAAKEQLQHYRRWSTLPVNLNRGLEYAAPVQSESISKTLGVIRAYLGWNVKKQGVRREDLDLYLYADAHRFICFIGYLMARGVEHGHVSKHIAVARKVRLFYNSTPGSHTHTPFNTPLA